MSFYKNGAGVYEATVEDRIAGRVHLSLRTRTKREAAARYGALAALVRRAANPADAEVLRQLRARQMNLESVAACYEAGRPFGALLQGDAWPTVGDAVTEYLAWVAAHPKRAESTLAMSRSRLGTIADLVGRDRRVDTLTTADVEGAADQPGLRARLAARGLGASTLAQYLIAFGALYRWLQTREDRRALDARREARRLHVPLDRQLIPEAGEKRVRFLEAGEARRLLAATPRAYVAAVGCGLFAGLRIDEVCHLTPRDVDLELGLVSVQPKTAPTRVSGVWKPKTRSSVRDVALEPSLAALLRAHLARHASAAWVFPSPRRGFTGPMSADHLGDLMTAVVATAGLATDVKAEKVTFHTLRHTFASWLVMEGVDLYTVSQLLGHKDISEVQATYAHLSPDHRRRAVAKLAQRFTLPALDTLETTEGAA